MSQPSVSRGLFIGEISKGERKTVGDKALIEFYLDGFGLRFNAWGDLADKIVATAPVGSTVIVEGQIKSRSYQVEGKDRTTTEIVVSSIENLNGVKPSPAAAAAPTSAALPEGGF